MTFLVSALLAIGLGVLGIHLVFVQRSSVLIEEEMLVRAKSHYESIVAFRLWNAMHGGVYVEKKPGEASTPWLPDPDAKTVDGRVLTKKNPALMTRELSEFSAGTQSLRFHITSLRPINPNNAPDAFEAASLKRFEDGAVEAETRERIGERTFFRYMAPLYVDDTCLPCHAKQGYAVGQVRGGISVSFSIDDIRDKLDRNILILVFLSAASGLCIILTVCLFFRHMRKRLEHAHRRLLTMAHEDSLTKIANRGSLMERFELELERARRTERDLGCIMFDIDFFKRVNDTHGHQVGDAVLRDLAAIVQTELRPYDTLGRYGGEEFLVALPDSDPATTLRIAQRLRHTVENELRAVDKKGGKHPVTISCGVANLLPDDPDVDAIIRRADNALYLAKAKGRNRVEVGAE